MPTYQYACTACDHQLEAVQSFTDDPLTQCPECQGRLRKRYGSVGVVFKGSGFYRTDSRSAANGAGSNGAGDKSAEKGADGGGESSGKSSESKSGDGKSGESKSSGDSGSGASSSSGGGDKSGGSGGTGSGGAKDKKAPASTS